MCLLLSMNTDCYEFYLNVIFQIIFFKAKKKLPSLLLVFNNFEIKDK